MKEIHNITTKDLLDLMGEITDYKSEFSDNIDMEKLEVDKGEFVEKYFSQKLKYLMKAEICYPIYIDTSNIKNLLASRLYYKVKKDPELKIDTADKIMKQVDKVLKNEKPIQIDSFIPLVDGKKIKGFLNVIKDYSFPVLNNIDENNKYTIIVESTFSLKSQIGKKADQLRRYFLIFSLIHKLYLKYPRYLDLFYKYFIRKYFLREKIKKDNIEDIEEEYNYKLDLSPYGNYLFIIATNKKFKSFKEVEYSIKTFAFEDDGPDESFKKCFETTHKNKIKNKNKVIKGKKESNPNFDILNISCDIKQKEKIAKKKYINDFDYSANLNKISRNKYLVNSYKSFNYLFQKINDEKNFKVMMIYLDTYLNLTTPKCFLLQKLDGIIDGIEAQSKKQKDLEYEINELKKDLAKEKNASKKIVKLVLITIFFIFSLYC